MINSNLLNYNQALHYFAHNLSPTIATYKSPIHDTGATNTFFRQSDSHILQNLQAGGGLPVGLPNGGLISSKATGTWATPPVSTNVHVFDDKYLNRSLISTADFCNQGCTAIFTATSSTIIHDATGTVISQNLKDPQARLWPHDLSKTASIPSASNVVRHEINADFVAYSHASFCSPVDSFMANALSKGWLGYFPRLTASMFNADKPNSTSTAKGHLRQTRQTSRSRKWNSSPPPAYDNLPDEPEYFNDIFAKVHKTTELLIG